MIMINDMEKRTRFEELIREIAECDKLYDSIEDWESMTIDDMAKKKIIKNRFKSICNELQENYSEDDFRLAFDIDEDIELRDTYYKVTCVMYNL